MSNVEELQPPDFPYQYGPRRGCDLCLKNYPTEETETWKGDDGEWHTVCRQCKESGA